MNLRVSYLFILLLLWLSCARYPTGFVAPGAERRLAFELSVAGKINPGMHYFIAIDTDGDPFDGPLPVVSGPYWENGWGTGSFTFHIEYFQGIARVYDDRESKLYPKYIGPAFDYRVLADGKTLRIVLDLNILGSPLSTIDFNFITTDKIIQDPNILEPKVYDALGPSGNDYRTIPLNVSANYSGEDLEGDVSVADFVGAEDLDIVSWRLEVKLG